MIKIYTPDTTTNDLVLIMTYDGEVKDIEETLATGFIHYLNWKEGETVKVEVSYHPEGSDYFWIKGERLFLDNYVVGSDDLGWANFYIKNLII